MEKIINQLAKGRRFSMDLRFDAGGVKMPGGHGWIEFGAGDASCWMIVSAVSSCSCRKIPLS